MLQSVSTYKLNGPFIQPSIAITQPNHFIDVGIKHVSTSSGLLHTVNSNIYPKDSIVT